MLSSLMKYSNPNSDHAHRQEALQLYRSTPPDLLTLLFLMNPIIPAPWISGLVARSGLCTWCTPVGSGAAISCNCAPGAVVAPGTPNMLGLDWLVFVNTTQPRNKDVEHLLAHVTLGPRH